MNGRIDFSVIEDRSASVHATGSPPTSFIYVMPNKEQVLLRILPSTSPSVPKSGHTSVSIDHTGHISAKRE